MDVPYVDFEVAEDVRNQRDLLVASSGEVHYAVQGQAPDIHLRFRHALTAVRFAVGSTLSWGKTITMVKLEGAYSKGRLRFPIEADGELMWGNLEELKTFTLSNINVSTSQLVNHVLTGNSGDNYTFFMLPQELGGETVHAHIYFSDDTELVIPLLGRWKAGTTKTYKLSSALGNSNWRYVLTAESPATLAYNEAQSGEYKVTSYRYAPDGTKQAVGWDIVGYDANGDNQFSMDEKPAWLTGLSTMHGEGHNNDAQTGIATVSSETIVERVAEISQGMKDAPVRGSAGAPYNLANQTNGGESIENTANCYVISAPGYYRLPLVYGNAVEGRINNYLAYNCYYIDGSVVLKEFKGHDGKAITTPYINVQHAANPATQASIVWADAVGLVSNPTVQGDGQKAFLNFEVKREHLVNGNAVVAVKNADGTVMWSWHLWFAPQSVLNKIPVINDQNRTYNFAGEALGMKYTTWYGTSYKERRSVRVQVRQKYSGKGATFLVQQEPLLKKGGITTLYQWGRKDAFPATDVVAEGSFVANAGDNMSFANGIQNPDKFYTWGNSWLGDGTDGNTYNYKNLWASQYDGSNSTFDVKKTVYDPCPVGFRMPERDAFTGFTTTGEMTRVTSEFNVDGHFEKGRYFYTDRTKRSTIFFPASGYRFHKTGELFGVGIYGHSWTGIPSADAGNGVALSFLGPHHPEIDPKRNLSFSIGLGVRPVAE